MPSSRSTLFALLAAVWAVPVLAGPLDDYVARPDESYDWQERRSGTLGETSWVELRLVSQTWRGITWRHQLYLLQPPNADGDVRQALLFIDGGRWKEEYDRSPAGAQLPTKSALFAQLAQRLGTPVAVLRQVPYQPIFDMREDDLIAHGFVQFLETGEADWLLLLPMVKSAVRAMDAVQAYAAESWDMEIDQFTVAGASKRGWTTWLTGAIDPRVTALAPMVIDVLNMQPQLEHQRRTWGAVSDQLADYTRRGIPEALDTEAGQRLLEIVDPYSYRERLLQPKLIVLATNDRYWPVDALNLYWRDLRGPKYVLYVPNDDHDLVRRSRIMDAIHALHAHAGGESSLPDLDWRFSKSDGVLRLSLRADVEPAEVVVWTAAARSRDFRNARWKARRARRDGDCYTFELRAPPRGYGAAFAELSFEQPTPYRLSTGVRIIPGSKLPAR